LSRPQRLPAPTRIRTTGKSRRSASSSRDEPEAAQRILQARRHGSRARSTSPPRGTAAPALLAGDVGAMSSGPRPRASTSARRPSASHARAARPTTRSPPSRPSGNPSAAPARGDGRPTSCPRRTRGEVVLAASIAPKNAACCAQRREPPRWLDALAYSWGSARTRRVVRLQPAECPPGKSGRGTWSQSSTTTKRRRGVAQCVVDVAALAPRCSRAYIARARGARRAGAIAGRRRRSSRRPAHRASQLTAAAIVRLDHATGSP